MEKMKLKSFLDKINIFLITILIFAPVFVFEIFFNSKTTSAEGPIEIRTLDDLNNIRNDLSGNYVLMNDINASETSSWNEGDGWEPIGTCVGEEGMTPPYCTDPEANSFTGSFDGQGHHISDLYINRPETDYIGLFGYANDAVIENVGLENVDMTGFDRTGGLAGLFSGDISNSHVSGDVHGLFWSIGGLVARQVLGTISNSYSTADVSGEDSSEIGGLVGYRAMPESVIANCFATGNISGGDEIGGLVGVNVGDISNSYASGNVTSAGGNYWVGGLVGTSGYLSTISNSYATGNVIGGEEGYSVGGLVGDNGGNIVNSYSVGNVSEALFNIGGLVGGSTGELYTVSNSFWDTETSGQATSDGGTGKTTEEMKNIETFTDTELSEGLIEAWNIVLLESYASETWFIDNGNSYPELGWKYVPEPDITAPTFLDFNGGIGGINITEGQTITTNPFIIKVRPADETAILKVEFYVDNNLLCTDTTADNESIYSCAWDTSQYHSIIRVIAYDTSNNLIEIVRNTTVNLSTSSSAVIPSMTELPRTGR